MAAVSLARQRDRCGLQEPIEARNQHGPTGFITVRASCLSLAPLHLRPATLTLSQIRGFRSNPSP